MLRAILNNSSGDAALSRFFTGNTWTAQQIFVSPTTTSPSAVFQANGTISAIPASEANVTAMFQGTEAVQSYTLFSSSAQQINVLFRRRQGTYASPTAVQSGNILGAVQWQGYGVSTFGSGAAAEIRGVTNQAFTESARGTQLEFYVTPSGQTASTLGLRLSAGTLLSGHNAEFFGSVFLKNTTNINFENNAGISESVLGISSANNVGITSPTASGNIQITNRATNGQIQLTAGTSTGQITLAAGGSVRVTVASGGKTTFSSTAINIATAQTPATSAAAGTAGDIAWDDTYLYVRMSTGWRRIALGAAF